MASYRRVDCICVATVGDHIQSFNEIYVLCIWPTVSVLCMRTVHFKTIKCDSEIFVVSSLDACIVWVYNDERCSLDSGHMYWLWGIFYFVSFSISSRIFVSPPIFILSATCLSVSASIFLSHMDLFDQFDCVWLQL